MSMNRSIQAILVGSAILLVSTSYAADWKSMQAAQVKTAFEAAAQKFVDKDSYRLEVTIRSFLNTSDGEPDETQSCTIWRSGERYKAQHFGYVSYQDADVRVMADPTLKEVYVSEVGEEFEMIGLQIYEGMFERAKGGMYKEEGNIRSYRLYLEEMAKWEYIEFTVDNDGWLGSYTIMWAQAMPVIPDSPISALVRPKLVFDFSKPTKCDLSESELKWENIVDGFDGTPFAIGSCAGFEVIDMRAR